MRHIPIRLGPLAILLTVISICMTTLGILNFTTARADLSLAQQYADTVRTRYELELYGQTFLRQVKEFLAEGGDITRMEETETDETGVIRKTFSENQYTLTVEIVPDETSGFRVCGWRIRKAWEPETDMGNLWLGD
ncbi:hypothetical protein NSB25_09210 [Acetatifactor muris]|jgi:hypothetical protein|uniref:Uncharacterized protein n=1 Tax=Acetatifactor muris TaxID=879566 RepID=A0A2K4ZA82_9FIRM|nr:hypothetical protein [Acetatifactor muris]MCR2047456.1 hypothetical protein [Acetatifactor muris]SOY27351.1 hypothetical protein AMURIS_00055 [Acetatifactor muris]